MGCIIYPIHLLYYNGEVDMIMLTILFVGCLIFAYLIAIESKKYPKWKWLGDAFGC